MNRALRRAHFRGFVVLALALPVGFVAALCSRAAAPAPDSGALDLTDFAAAPPADAIDVSARFAPLAIRASFAAAARRVWIESIAPLAAPDVLVYAGATAAGADGRLPSDARLLGTLPQSGRRAFQLAAGESFVVLYSLGHQVVIAGASLAERAR